MVLTMSDPLAAPQFGITLMTAQASLQLTQKAWTSDAWHALKCRSPAMQYPAAVVS